MRIEQNNAALWNLVGISKSHFGSCMMNAFRSLSRCSFILVPEQSQGLHPSPCVS